MKPVVDIKGSGFVHLQLPDAALQEDATLIEHSNGLDGLSWLLLTDSELIDGAGDMEGCTRHGSLFTTDLHGEVVRRMSANGLILFNDGISASVLNE